MARETGLEPAASGVTGRRSNQLSYSRFGSRLGTRPPRQCQSDQPRPDHVFTKSLGEAKVFTTPKVFTRIAKTQAHTRTSPHSCPVGNTAHGPKISATPKGG